MTRVNVIPPKRLVDAHLLAEAREIKRIPNAIRKGRYSLKGVPTHYAMGAGHVKFFYNKLGWLLERYKALYDECVCRGFQVTDFSEAWEGVPESLMNGWNPTEEDEAVTIRRVSDRLSDMKKIKYYSSDIDYQQAINILTNSFQ